MQSLCKRLAVGLLLAALLAYVSIANAEQYLCVAEKSSGFSYDTRTKTWEGAIFSTDGKYLVSESKNVKYAYRITKIGIRSKYPFAACIHDFDKYGYLYCTDYGLAEFKFNRISGRFLLALPYGYYDVLPDEDLNNPYMEIGKCSPF